MRKRNKIIIIVLVLVILAGIFLSGGKKATPKYTSARVEKGDIEQTVSATGAAEAKKKIDLKFLNSGQVQVINVKTGDSVKKGDVLAKLDTSKIDSQLAQAEAALDTARANLQTLLDGASSEEIRVYETAVKNAETALESAKAAQKNDVESSKASVSSAETTLNNANTNLANVIASNESNLNHSYEDAFNNINSSLLSCEEALDKNEEVLEDDDAQDTLSVLNSSYLSSAKNNKTVAEASYDEALAFQNNIVISSGSYTNSSSSIESSIDKTMSALSSTKTALSSTALALQSTITSTDLTQTELDALKTSISAKRTAVDTAISTLSAKRQAISTQKVTNQTGLDTATASVNSASSALAVANSNLYSVTSSSANNVSAKEGDLQRAKDQLNQIKAGPASSKRSSYQAQVDQAAASVDLIKKQIEDSSIIAPYDGIVTSLEGEIGETVSSAEIFVTMIISNGFEIKANVPEVEISRVKIGDKVNITFDALDPEDIFEGQVSEIDPAETEISGVIYYKVMTIFTADSAVIKPGMTANLDIMTARRENVVKIPFQALKEKDDGSKYVQIVENGEIKEVLVKVGLKGDVDLEIVEGLAEGQEVVTFIEEGK